MRTYLSIALLAALALGAGAGCVATAHGQLRGSAVVYSEPPPPRRVVVETRPGYLWVDGQWMWVDGRWVWYDGYWETERPGYVYVAGYWKPRGSRYVWVEPRWRRGHTRPARGGGVVVNDHRSSRGSVVVPARSNRGVVVPARSGKKHHDHRGKGHHKGRHGRD